MRTPNYRLALNGRLCISCGICMDLCPTRAIAMRLHGAAHTIEGALRTHRALLQSGSREAPANDLMTYPYLHSPSLCNGCSVCIRQCPVSALTLMDGNRVIEEPAFPSSKDTEPRPYCLP